MLIIERLRGRKIILHVDVNKILIAVDNAGGKDLTKMMMDILADNTFYCWDATIKTPISYHDYVFEHLLTSA